MSWVEQQERGEKGSKQEWRLRWRKNFSGRVNISSSRGSRRRGWCCCHWKIGLKEETVRTARKGATVVVVGGAVQFGVVVQGRWSREVLRGMQDGFACESLCCWS